MDWLRENLHWIFIGLALIWMHTRMHGAHGGSDEKKPRSHDDGSDSHH